MRSKQLRIQLDEKFSEVMKSYKQTKHCISGRDASLQLMEVEIIIPNDFLIFLVLDYG